MAYLLRKLSNKDSWAEVEGSPLWAKGDCPSQALEQVFDNRSGVSTWRVTSSDTSSEEIERVIVAQAIMRATIGDFAYCLIDESRLIEEGIKTKDTPQSMIDKEIQNRHVDLVGIIGKQLVRLAHLINSEFDPKVMTRDVILKAAAKFFAEGKFDREFLFRRGNKGRTDAEISNSKELLVHLWKRSEINLSK
jgi:hypothetical protein